MRIAFLVRVFPPRFETFVVRQVLGLLDLGHHVDVFARRASDTWSNVPNGRREQLLDRTHYRPVVPRTRTARVAKATWLVAIAGWRKPTSLVRFACSPTVRRTLGWTGFPYEAHPFLQHGTYDLVHCQYVSLGLVGSTMSDLGIIQAPLVVSVRGGADMLALESLDSKPRSRLFKNANALLTVNRVFRERVAGMGCPMHKLHVHRSGIDCQQIMALADSHHRSPSRETDAPDLVSASRLEENKGIEYAIRALKQLEPTFPNLRYEVIGDGPDREKLGRLAMELGLRDRVRFLGWLNHEETLRRVSRAVMYVLPCVTASNGRHEGIPNALKEAMALGKPVVTTLHSGIPELVEDGVSGFLVPEKDVRALTNRIERLVADPDLRHRMGEAGRRHVVEHYDSSKLSTELVRIYQQAIDVSG